MPDPKHDRLRRLFDHALELPIDARGPWLARECRDDEPLRQRVAAMLAVAEDDGGATAMPRGPSVAADGATMALAEGPGSRIGPYKLLQQIGEGGFGAVFLAEQTEPVTRRVALKIVKLGMDTRQVVARFEQERQALALMDHPNIARVLDAGATATGRPYFVMDLVKGSPIVDYCDQNHLSIEERLGLFAQICSAVQHAHGKGIIHRDLKPSNVLVGTQDGKPQVKVIDFGIAKATSQKLTDKTLFTEHQQVIGTLQYMSPEQAEGSLDIDTRTDVYSLGVLLYELLTGSTPFDMKTIRGALFGELQRMIREVEPPRPSTRLSQSRDILVALATQRRTEPRRLGTLVRGDLDWIVMKALEKDRSRRYETANGLAMDIQRHLAGEAVVAAPPSTSYRCYKFVRRNRGPVAAALAVAVALLVGVLAFAWQAQIARDERDQANVARTAEAEQRRVADEQRTRAEANAREAKTRADELDLVADFQAGMLDQIDPTAAGMQLRDAVQAQFATALLAAQPAIPEAEQAASTAAFRKAWQRVNATDVARELIDRTILKPAAATIEARFADQPLVAARLQQSLGLLYRQLGLYEAAQPLQQAALDTRRRLLGPEHEDTLLSLGEHGNLRKAQGHLDEAEADLREVVTTYRKLFGDDHPATLNATGSLGELLWNADRPAEAEPMLRETLAKLRRIQGDDHPETLVVINNLGLLLSAQGRYAEAEPLYRESLERSLRVLGPDHKDTLVSLNNVGWLLQTLDRLDDAEPYFVQGLEKRRRLLGAEHPHTLNAINNLGMLMHRQGKLQAAEPLLQEALQLRIRVLGDEHRDTLISQLNLGLLLRDLGKSTAATKLLEACLATLRTTRGEADQTTQIARNALATAYADGRRHAEIVALLAPTEAEARTAFLATDNGRRLATTLTLLGSARAALATEPGDFATAAGNLLEAMPLHERTRGAAHKSTVQCMQALANLYAAWDKVEPGRGHADMSAAWAAKVAADK